MYNTATAYSKASGATNLFMGDSWTAQEARVKAGLQERNTALDNVSWKNYDHIMKDKSLSIDDKVKAIFNGEPIAAKSDTIPIQQAAEVSPNISDSMTEAEKARIAATSTNTAQGVSQSVTTGLEGLSEIIKPDTKSEQMSPVAESGSTGSISDEETRAVSEYVLRYIFGENANGAAVMNLF
jgi:hypothetical protein